MKVEILYFHRCPTYKATEKTLRKVIYEEGIDLQGRHRRAPLSSQAGVVVYGRMLAERPDGASA